MKVVILSLNHPGITKMCVGSALVFFKPDDIFLVHNGSREDFVCQLKEDFKTIHHLVFQDNAGYTGGANRGLKHAFERGAEKVFFLTNDTKLTSFTDPPEADFVCPRILLRDTKRTYSFGGKVNFYTGRLTHVTILEDESSDPTFYVPGSAFIMSQQAWSKTMGFDETLDSYWEDVDLSLRARKLGLTFAMSQDIILKHGVAKTTGNNPFYLTYLYHRNQRRVIWRHGKATSKIPFIFNYSCAVSKKLFRHLKNRDGKRLKLLLKALIPK